MNVVTQRAEVADLTACAEVLAAAFAASPWTQWTVDSREHADRLCELQRMALEHFAVPFGDISVTMVDGVVVSVAAWTDSEQVASAAANPTLASRVAELEGDRHEASRDAQRQLEPLRPSRRHLSLGVVGTHPAHQRQGLATLTLAPLLAIADDQHVPIWLETSESSNVEFYERIGFIIDHHVTIADAGPDVWIMHRPDHTGQRR